MLVILNKKFKADGFYVETSCFVLQRRFTQKCILNVGMCMTSPPCFCPTLWSAEIHLLCCFTTTEVFPWCINTTAGPSGLALPLITMSRQSWHQQCWILVQFLLVVSLSKPETTCSHRGDLENPQIVKDGNILLGGIFPFHSSWKNRQENFTHKPLPLQCER